MSQLMPRIPDRIVAAWLRSRPLVVRPVIGAWLVFGYALYRGYDSYDRNFNPELTALSWDPGPNVGSNFRTYRHAAELALSGEPFYNVAPPALDQWAVYLYPPITVVTFYPVTALEWLTGYGLLVALNLLAGLAAAMLIVRFIEARGRGVGWLDLGLIFAVFALSPFSWGTIYYGNINLLLALAFVVGFLALWTDHETLAGTAFALAALWKLFPALVGFWLLRQRAWRAIGAAIAVGGGGVVAGIVLFGWRTTHIFITEVVFGRADTARFVGGYPGDGRYFVTIQRPLSHVIWNVWPNAPRAILVPTAVLVAIGILGLFYVRLDTGQDHLFAIFATVAITVTLMPSQQWYLVMLFFPMIPLLYLWDGPGQYAFVLGAVVLFFNERPGSMIEWLGETGVPAAIEWAGIGIFTFATVQLYAIGLMAGACLWCKYDGPRQVRAGFSAIDGLVSTRFR